MGQAGGGVPGVGVRGAGHGWGVWTVGEGSRRSAHSACLPDPAFSCLNSEVSRREEGGVGPSNAGAPAVSEPNLKLRYKPKKSLERRKNPLLRKESAPPSLRRRPAETLGGKGPQGGRRWPWCPSGSGPARTGLQCVVPEDVSYTLAGAPSWGCKPAPAPLATLTSAQKKGHLNNVPKGAGG